MILRDFPQCQAAVDKAREEGAAQLIVGAATLRDLAAGKDPGGSRDAD
jgi:hypothetical protein